MGGDVRQAPSMYVRSGVPSRSGVGTQMKTRWLSATASAEVLKLRSSLANARFSESSSTPATTARPSESSAIHCWSTSMPVTREPGVGRSACERQPDVSLADDGDPGGPIQDATTKLRGCSHGRPSFGERAGRRRASFRRGRRGDRGSTGLDDRPDRRRAPTEALASTDPKLARDLVDGELAQVPQVEDVAARLVHVLHTSAELIALRHGVEEPAWIPSEAKEPLRLPT